MGNNYDTYTTTSSLSQQSPVITYTILGLSVLFAVLMLVGRWKVYKKAGRHGVASIIPIWNEITFFQAGSDSTTLGIVYVLLSVALGAFWYVVNQLSASPTLISMANSDNIVVTGILGAGCATMLLLLWFFVSNTHKLSKHFEKGFGTTLGLLILPSIFYLALGFGRAEYDFEFDQEELSDDFESGPDNSQTNPDSTVGGDLDEFDENYDEGSGLTGQHVPYRKEQSPDSPRERSHQPRTPSQPCGSSSRYSQESNPRQSQGRNGGVDGDMTRVNSRYGDSRGDRGVSRGKTRSNPATENNRYANNGRGHDETRPAQARSNSPRKAQNSGAHQGRNKGSGKLSGQTSGQVSGQVRSNKSRQGRNGNSGQGNSRAQQGRRQQSGQGRNSSSRKSTVNKSDSASQGRNNGGSSEGVSRSHGRYSR